jgi:hypothetical protein
MGDYELELSAYIQWLYARKQEPHSKGRGRSHEPRTLTPPKK